MSTVGANKRSRKGKETHEADDTISDRLSDLPDDILCQILSRIPTKSAVQTSVLSKRWGRVWTSVPTFEAGSFGHYSMAFVNKFMEKYFYHRLESKVAITSFELCMGYRGAKWRVDRCLDSAISNHIKEFKLYFILLTFRRPKVHIYSFPHSILLRLRSLNILELVGMKWPMYDISSVNFPLLKVLSLCSIYGLVDEQLSALLLASPLLEELNLINCVDLENPKLNSSNLKSLRMISKSFSSVTRTIQVEAGKMESLIYDRGYNQQSCRLTLVSCESTKYLSLSNASVSDWLLKGLVTALPLLEILVLESCHELRHIELESESLKRLVVKNTGHCLEKKATIVAPKLALFSYFDESFMSLSLNSPSFLEANIQIYSKRKSSGSYSRQWYVNLIDFLSSLDSCKELSIQIPNEKALIIPTELRTEYLPPLPTLKHLKVKTAKSLFRKRMFKASLNWISPSVETLTIE